MLELFSEGGVRTVTSKRYLGSTVKMSLLEKDAINFSSEIKKRWFRKNNLQ